MRIRKRKVPLPISSLSPIPLSDPLFHPQMQLRNLLVEDDTDEYYDPKPGSQPSDESAWRLHHVICEEKPGEKMGDLGAAERKGGKRRERIKSEKEEAESSAMEGSRCSRVNGRGWRCRQQTLVGYSLCEHHLGKGRLRNMNNSLGKSVAPSEKTTASRPDSSSKKKAKS